METRGAIFNSGSPRYKYCSICRKPMSNSIESDVCPACEQESLYKQVRDYINENHPTEMEIANHFNMDTEVIHEWIKQGLFEYRKGPLEF